MRRIGFGIALILHGLAHAYAAMLAANGSRIVPTALWAVASTGFLAAGLGLFGVRRADRHWQILALVALTASLMLLVAYRPDTWIPGIVTDVILLALLGFLPIPHREWRRPPTRWSARAGHAIPLMFVVYVGVVIITRPWHSRWGSSMAELRTPLPGDDLVPNPRYTLQHAVTIHGTPSDVWPWLVQLGQDRGGFYSYAWLERAAGDDIRNAERIHPEWQTLREGDLVRATQPDYLGGRFGRDLGWRVVRVEPNRVLALGGWGAFVIQPLGTDSVRLIVRTRGNPEPETSTRSGGRSPDTHPQSLLASVRPVAFAPFGAFVFEPAHFIMERAMLRGIKARVERRNIERSTADL